MSDAVLHPTVFEALTDAGHLPGAPDAEPEMTPEEQAAFTTAFLDSSLKTELDTLRINRARFRAAMKIRRAAPVVSGTPVPVVAKRRKTNKAARAARRAGR